MLLRVVCRCGANIQASCLLCIVHQRLESSKTVSNKSNIQHDKLIKHDGGCNVADGLKQETENFLGFHSYILILSKHRTSVISQGDRIFR